MHSRDLIELAALVTAHGRALITSSTRPSATAMNDYWTASKCRMDRWSLALRCIGEATESGDAERLSKRLPRVVSIVQEVLAGDVLSRVWTAVVTAHDRYLQGGENEPVVRSTMAGHAEARNRVLRLLLHSPVPGRCDPPDRPGHTVTLLEQYRRRTERWTDLLIAYLLTEHDVSEFAFDRQRAVDFADDVRRQERDGAGPEAWSLTLGSLRAAFRSMPNPPTTNADLNARIASSILVCFDTDCFESTGSFGSLWLARLTSRANDAWQMIDELVALD